MFKRGDKVVCDGRIYLYHYKFDVNIYCLKSVFNGDLFYKDKELVKPYSVVEREYKFKKLLDVSNDK